VVLLPVAPVGIGGALLAGIVGRRGATVDTSTGTVVGITVGPLVGLAVGILGVGNVLGGIEACCC